MKVVALNVYPVKSMRGLAVAAAEVGMPGFAQDREWLIGDAEGQFLTAREWQSLLLWRPQPTADGLLLVAPDGERLLVRRADHLQVAQVLVWRDVFQAYTGLAATDDWLSRKLGRPSRLFYLGARTQRPFIHTQQGLSFADGAPYLITTKASLDALNAELAEPVGMARFRANIVIDGLQAYEEDHWKRLRVGGIEFSGFKACARCKIVNLDPETAELSPGKEPLKTLSKTHRLSEGACFGVNLFAHSCGQIRVGDAVEVLA